VSRKSCNVHKIYLLYLQKVWFLPAIGIKLTQVIDFIVKTGFEVCQLF